MKPLCLPLILGMALAPVAASATINTYINNGVITSPPQIDAINFVNNGIFSIATSQPFDTSNTLNFTNRGSMTGLIGWRFDHVNNAPGGNGTRGMASSFHNHVWDPNTQNGSITAVDAGATFPSKLLINASNVVNQGVLTVGSSGLLNINAKNARLNRSGLQVLPMFGRGSSIVGTNGFRPDYGILDLYWGIGTNNINSGNILNMIEEFMFVVSPVHQVTFAGGFTGSTQIGVVNPVSFVFENFAQNSRRVIAVRDADGNEDFVEVFTNITVQAAFVGISDTNVFAQASFFPSSRATNLFHTITVELSSVVRNPVTAEDDVMTLYFMDRLAAETNRTLFPNLDVFPRTFRPWPYIISRLEPFQFSFGEAANSEVWPEMLFDPDTFAARFVDAEWAAYMAEMAVLSAKPPLVPGASITNTPGRIEIHADELDLTRTRFRADSLISINTAHLMGSSNAIVDTIHTTYNLANTNNTLRVQNLALREVVRLGGDLRAWSGMWTNTITIELENYDEDGEEDPIEVQIRAGFHVLILDATSINTRVPVVTHNFVTRSTNVFLHDPLSITESFYTDATAFTLVGTNAAITLPGFATDPPLLPERVISNWVWTNAPNLRFFTNGGTIMIANEAHFEAALRTTVTNQATGVITTNQQIVPYTSFANIGTHENSGIYAQGINVRSTLFNNSSTISSGSSLIINTTTGQMENAQTFTGAELIINAATFRFRNYTNQSYGQMRLTITNSLADAGPGSNVRIASDGFHVRFADGGRPGIGDLLGTTIESTVPIFASVQHTWPAADRGASSAGFANNLALGYLRLTIGFDGEAFFTGTLPNSALYVDYLEIIGATLDDIDWALRVDSNLIIYFADSNLGAEALDGRLGGRLRWVRDFAGPFSSVDVPLEDGTVIRVNRALRFSTTIDSDGDGLANAFDPTPFGGMAVSVALINEPPLSAEVSWQAAAYTVYRIEYATSLAAANWQFLTNYTNSASTSGVVAIRDQVPANGPQRFYRVRYTP
jgi:hypothetical protein